MDARHRQHISGLWSNVAVLPGRQHLLIGFPAAFSGGIGSLSIWAVIDEGPDGDTRYELRHSAYVVIVIMREQHVIDPADPRLVGGGYDTVRVAAIVVRPSSIDEQGLAGRSYKERGLAALHVNHANLELPFRARFGPSRDGRERHSQCRGSQ